ncbi:MarC family protein [Candidatus Woesearchaeota archaeon]|nr:MarC family protein [Candidatus Woesearchaeota archaeon]
MEGLLEAFIALFVIMDPIGNLPILISLTKGMPIKEIKRNVDGSVFVAGVLLFIFLFFGVQVFNFFGIDLDSFQIAGGIILLIMGILYVFGTSLKYVKSHGFNLSVPVGTPLLTGPGVITITIILVKESGILVTVIAAFLTLLATWIILINSSRLYKILGEQWTSAISRIMGIILAAVAVKFITGGILNIIGPLL